MIKKLLVTAFLALGLATPALAWNLNDLNRVVDQNNFQVGGGCSGTLVSTEHRMLFTAYHCIEQAIKSEEETEQDEDGQPLKDEDGKPIKKKKKTIRPVPVSQLFIVDGVERSVTYEADIIARDSKLDLAVLQIPEGVGPITLNLSAERGVPLVPRSHVEQRGATIWHVGNPRMQYGTITKGIVSSYRNLEKYDFDEVGYYLQFDSGITGGSSGGALFNDNGEYIGTVVMVVNGMGGELHFMGLAVPMSDMWELLSKNCLADELGGENIVNDKPRTTCKNTEEN